MILNITILYKYNGKQIYLTHRLDTAPDQSEPGRMAMEDYFKMPKSP